MKHFLQGSKLLALALLLSVSTLASAQNPQMEARLETLKNGLDLTEQQQSTLQGLTSAYSQRIIELQQRLIVVQREMLSIDLSALNEASIKDISRRAANISGQHTEATLRLQMDFYALLNDAQKKKYDSMRAQRSSGLQGLSN